MIGRQLLSIIVVVVFGEGRYFKQSDETSSITSSSLRWCKYIRVSGRFAMKTDSKMDVISNGKLEQQHGDDTDDDGLKQRASSDVDIEKYSVTLRKQTEDTISLLQKLYRANEVLKSEQQQMRSDLDTEHQKRLIAENALRTLEQTNIQLQAKHSQLSAQVVQLQEEVQARDEQLSRAIEEKDSIVSKLTNDIGSQQSLMRGLKYMWQNIDAFRVGEGILQEPSGACMLPDGCVLVADTIQGLLLFSAQTELIRQVAAPEWKWPQSLVYDTEAGRILVTMAVRQSDDRYRRAIGVFNLQLELTEFIEAPDDGYIDERVAKESLCLARGGEMYLSLCDKVASALYKYSLGTWSLLTKRPGQSFIDCQVLAVLGPVTELLVVEQRKGYVHLLSVRNDAIIDRKALAMVETPGAICVDEKSQLFIHDIMAGKVRQMSTARFEPQRDICVTDPTVFSICASHGYLGVAFREDKVVRVFRYVSTK